MTPKEQLNEWVIGNNLHNNDRDECCPDFACCQPNNHWPILMRERFAKIYTEEGADACIPMLMMGLSGAFIEENIHIVGMMQNNG